LSDTTFSPRVHTFANFGETRLKPSSDDALMKQLQEGRPEALGVLFDRYHRLVFDVARRILKDRSEAEDVMQDIFIEVYRRAALYDASKGTVKIWLLQYAYHRSFNRRKYLVLRNFYDGSPATALAQLELCVQQSGDEEITAREWEEILRRGIKQLGSKERQIIELVAFDGLTVREASSQMRDSYTNGRNHYYRGLKKLREFLARLKPDLRQEVKHVRS
jgi:RNA polymerase sigma-70 factor (ECF subfamily)